MRAIACASCTSCPRCAAPGRPRSSSTCCGTSISARFDPVVVTLSPEPADLDAGGLPRRSGCASCRCRCRGFARSLNRGWRRDIERLVGGSSTDRLRRAFAGHPRRRHRVAAPRRRAARRDCPEFSARRLPAEVRPPSGPPDGARPISRRSARCRTSSPARRRSPRLLRTPGIDAAVIPNGVDTATFRPAAAGRARTAARRARPADGGTGSASRSAALSARKDPLVIVRALRAAGRPRPRVRLRWAAVRSRRDCRREAGGDARIRFAGQVDDVTPLPARRGLPRVRLALRKACRMPCSRRWPADCGSSCRTSSRTGNCWTRPGRGRGRSGRRRSGA